MPEQLRAAIYARYSTALQSERSCEDQIDVCRAYAKREGYRIIDTFEDKAVSGGSVHGRVGLAQLKSAVMEGLFDVIIVEALDRLSRDMEDLAGLYKQLTFAGIKLVAVHEGEANTVLVGLRGLIGQLYREDNVHKIRRGMSGLIKQGQTAGGRAYGYRPNPTNPGKPIIVPEEAEIVQRIFECYAKGISPKRICRTLNAEHVPPPRGKCWQPSALIGFKERGTGILRNEIYRGRPIWNKVRMVKDPSTGKRVSRPNPPSEWQSGNVPELRIVSDELFEAVRIQLAANSHSQRKDNFGIHKRPKRLLSGLLKCGACGSGMAVAGTDKSGRSRLRCSAHTNSGACPDPKTFYLCDVEELVIDSMTSELATPDQIRKYAEIYMRERRRLAAQENRRRDQLEARIKANEKENARLVDLMVKDGADAETLGAKSKDLGLERDRLRLELTSLPQGSNVVVHPASIERFARKLAEARPKLEMALHLLDDMGELSLLIREAIESITLYREEDGALTIKVTSWLTPFIEQVAPPRTALSSPGAVPLVAEEGLIHPHYNTVFTTYSKLWGMKYPRRYPSWRSFCDGRTIQAASRFVRQPQTRNVSPKL